MRVENARVEKYEVSLKDIFRPRSRGGNTRAWHHHVLTIEGEIYLFLAPGVRKWVYAGDTVSFDWDWDDNKRYRNVDSGSISVRAKTGRPVVRWRRGSKHWRAATKRRPTSRRERCD